jgi:hypothetical protein
VEVLCPKRVFNFALALVFEYLYFGISVNMLNIYIDESGSFVSAESQGAWSLSAALVIPKSDERECKEALRKLKVKSGVKHNDEIKLKDVSNAFGALRVYLQLLNSPKEIE